MKQNEEAERMRQLLVEAVSTLCRSGIRFRAAMRVEGLIGITVDEEDIILVNVNKTFEAANKDSPDADETSTHGELVVESPDPESTRSPKARNRKRSRKGSQSPLHTECVEESDDEQDPCFVVKQEPQEETVPGRHKRLKHPSGNTATSSVPRATTSGTQSTIHIEAVKQCPTDNDETEYKDTSDCLQDSDRFLPSGEASSSSYAQHAHELSQAGQSSSDIFSGSISPSNVKVEISSESESEGAQTFDTSHSDLMFASDSNTFTFPPNMQLAPVPVSMYGPGETVPGVPAQLNYPAIQGVLQNPVGASSSKKEPERCECRHCTKIFRYSHDLRDHLQTHEEETAYRCPVCSRSFRWRKALKLHMNVHDESKMQRCNECFKVFPTRSMLMRHLNTVMHRNAHLE